MKVFSWCLALSLGWSVGLRADARSDFLAAAEAQKAGQWAEAAQGYSKVTAQQPAYAPAWKQLATARYYLGDHEGAVASADRYLALQPTDTAFSSWADRLRQKLGLPPRATPVPSPAPAAPLPVLAAAPTPEGLLSAAPPPGADAEVVPIEQAAAANSVAAAKIAALEQEEAERSAQQLVEETSVRRRRAPSSGNLKLGARLLGGWALGAGSFAHGEDVDSATTPTLRSYQGAPGGGGVAVAELLLILGERVDLGVGVYPVLWSDNRKSSQSAAVTRSNSSEANAAFAPVMASLTWRQPVLKGFNALLGAGFGIVPSTQVRVKSQTVQTTPSGLSVASVDARLDYGMTPAWRVLAGGEWALGPKLSLDLGVQVLGASFADAGGSADVEVTDETGAVTYQAKGLVVSPQALQLMSVGFLAGLRVQF